MTVDKNSIKLSGVKKYNIMLADTNLINGLFDVWVILFYQKRLWDRKLHHHTCDAVFKKNDGKQE